MKNFTLKKLVIVSSIIISNLTLNSQTAFWNENFDSSSETPDEFGLAENFVGANGTWTKELIGTNGTNSNLWFISAEQKGLGVGHCAEAQMQMEFGVQYNCMFISPRHRSTDFIAQKGYGAVYSTAANTETNCKMKSPVINLAGKQNVILSFDYLIGNLEVADFKASYFNGTEWIDLPRLSSTYSEFCISPKQYLWARSPEYSLPSSINNISNFQIAFTFTIAPTGENEDLRVSVAIDNISLSTNTVVDPNNNANRTANPNKIDIKTVADKKSNPNIVFTTYSEKFPANDLVIESSTDGTDFNELSKIKSKAVKGSVTKLEYSFSDANANDGVNYYRIKQVNADKTTVISKIVSVDHIKAKNITFTVYPNPNSGQFTVDFSGIENNHEVQIVLNDMNDGHEIYSTTFYSNSIDSNKMDVNPPTKIAPGRYICSLIFEGIRSSVIVMIN